MFGPNKKGLRTEYCPPFLWAHFASSLPTRAKHVFRLKLGEIIWYFGWRNIAGVTSEEVAVDYGPTVVFPGVDCSTVPSGIRNYSWSRWA